MKTVKTGVIGTGFIGPAHVEALRRIPNIEVVALADVDADTARQKAEMLGIPSHYGDYRTLLAREDLDAVHICTPNNLHFRMAKQALEAGKHVICEKPLATELSEARELVELARKKNLVNAVHFNVRYYPLMAHVRQMIQKGELGTIFSVHGSYLQDWLFHPTDYNWRLEPELSGRSRAVADVGSHWMDLIENVTGLRIVEVLADFATFHKRRKKPLKPVETYAGKLLKPEDYAEVPIGTEDYATVLLGFDNGARGVYTVSQVFAGRKNRLYFEIAGSKKAAAWESELPNQLWLGSRDGPNELLLRDPSLVHPDSRELINFPGGHNEGFPDTSKQVFKQVYADIRAGRPCGNDPPYPTFAAGLRELELCDRIMESSEKRAWVQV
ncbi:MAG: Gfo/Idh/MocA family oxidoreductase [Spirochaetales bacterium]|nr:Gfo/Idh/MocA family oxidoreductase [Spirochaetales bacterium]